MLNISDRAKALFYESSVPKSLTVYIYDWVEDPEGEYGGQWTRYKTLTDSDILSESLDLVEGVLDDNHFYLGGVISKQCSFERFYDGSKISQKPCKVILSIKDPDTMQYVAHINLCEGFIVEDVLQDNAVTCKVTVYDHFRSIFDRDIGANSTILNAGVLRAYEYIDLCCNNLSIIFPVDTVQPLPEGWMTPVVFTAKFNNAARFVNLSATATGMGNSYTGAQFLQESAEFLGGFIRCRKSVFDPDNSDMVNYYYPSAVINYLKLDTYINYTYPSTTLYPSSSIFPLFSGSGNGGALNSTPWQLDWWIRTKYATDDLTNYNGVSLYDGNAWRYQTNASATNKYVIEENRFLRGMAHSTSQELSILGDTCNDILKSLAHNNYPLGTLEMPYLPFMEAGDSFIYTEGGNTIVLPIMKCHVTGINNMRATVECLANGI